MSWAVILQILAALGGLAGIGAIINAVFARKKIAAEATNIAQDANTKIITNLTSETDRLQRQLDDYERDAQRLRTQLRELSERVAFYDLEMSDLRVLMMGNVNWARRAFEMLNAANQELKTNGISIQYNIEPPPDASALLARFGYIESHIKRDS